MKPKKLIATIFLFLIPLQAYAGMPMFRLTDIARLRLNVISFFLILILFIGFILQRVWNYLQHDFPFLPRLTYKKALGFVAINGLFFYLILTMISGARELMTPGAWVQKEATYQLKPPEKEPIPWLNSAREKKIALLRMALWKYGEENQGSMPRDEFDQGISSELWLTIDPNGSRYIFLPGKRFEDRRIPLAYEPGIFGEKRYVLFSNGYIEKISISKIQNLIRGIK